MTPAYAKFSINAAQRKPDMKKPDLFPSLMILQWLCPPCTMYNTFSLSFRGEKGNKREEWLDAGVGSQREEEYQLHHHKLASNKRNVYSGIRLRKNTPMRHQVLLRKLNGGRVLLVTVHCKSDHIDRWTHLFSPHLNSTVARLQYSSFKSKQQLSNKVIS